MVKDILGHNDIHTTTRYAHAITEQSLDAVEAFAEKKATLDTLSKLAKALEVELYELLKFD